MLIAVAAMASVSCQKEEAQAPVEPKSTTITLKADVVDTKTYITEDNAVLWGTGEYVQLYYNDGADKFAKSSADAADLWDDESSAMFSFDITYDEADSYVLGGIYPASCVVEDSNDNPSAYKVTLPAIQNASASSYDPKAFIMVMQPQTVTTFDTEAHLASFRRAVALNKVTLTGVKEDVSSVEITLPEGQYLAGRRYFDLTTGVEGEVYNSQTNTIKVNAEYTGSSIDVWFTSWGVELAEGDQVTIKMISATKVYTRTISVNSNGLKFVEGGLNKLAVNMASAEEEVLDNLAGEYLIAAMPGAWALMSGTNNGSYYSSVASDVSSSAADVLSSDFYGVENIEDYVWVISEVDGGYAVQNKSTGKYLAAWDSGNSAKTSEEAVAFSIAVNDDKSAKINDKTTTDRSLQYNSGSPRFAFYSTTQKPLYFIPWVADSTPRISVSTNALDVDADAETVEFTYTLHNVEGTPEVTIVDGATMTNVEAAAADGTVTVTFDANTEEVEKTATLVLSAEGAEDVQVVLTQDAWRDPNVIARLTVAEFAELEDGEEAELTGTITGIYQEYNSTYNNISFYLKDDSRDDPIIIFRMSCEGIDYTKVAVGNVITVQGPRGNYNGTAQMAAGGVCISIVEASVAPEITFADNTVTITAAQGASIYYTLDGSDPSTTSTEYTDAFAITASATVKAIAVEDGKPQSVVVEKICNYVDPNAGGGDAVEVTWHSESWANCTATATVYGTATFEGDLGSWSYTGCSAYDASQFTTKESLALGKTADNSSITSPTFANGIQGIKFNYFANDTARKVVVTIYENDVQVYQQTITPSAKNTLGAAEIVVETSGATYFTFTPGSTSRRVSVGDIQVKY